MASSSSSRPPNNPNNLKGPGMKKIQPFASSCPCCLKNLEQLHVQEIVKNTREISPEDPRFFFRLYSKAAKLDCVECEGVKLRLELLPSTSCWTAHTDTDGYINVMMRREHGHFMLTGTSVYQYFLMTKDLIKQAK